MQTKSRRIFLAGTAAAASALVTRCSPPAIAATSPDAELFRLGVEFDQAEAAWTPLWREWRRHERLWRDALDARGMSFERDGIDAVFAVFDDAGGAVASQANDDALARLDAIALQIREHRPATLAGLAVWAKVARFDGTSIFDREKAPQQREHHAGVILDFFDLIDAMAAQAVQS